MVRAVGWKIHGLELAAPSVSQANRVRCAGKLEACLPELLGVLSLPGGASAVQKVSPYDSAENDLTEGPFLGGFMKVNQGKSLTMSGSVCALPVTGKGQENTQQVFYYSIFPNMLL